MRFVTADSIFNGKEFIAEVPVLVLRENGVLDDIIAMNQVDTGKVEKHEGILTPGFVNAHCHLELSHMKSLILKETGLASFAREIITKRNSVSTGQQMEIMATADRQMHACGIVAVGDICNTAQSIQIKNTGKLFYHSFIELIGLNPARKEQIMAEGILLVKQFREHGLRASLAPHAPYSTSRELIGAIAATDLQDNLPLSIHNQESPDEQKFFEDASGGFKELYDFLKLDLSWFTPPKMSSLAWYANEIKTCRAVLVHNTFSTANDLERLKDADVFWCFCPRANLYIESSLPDYKLFATAKEKLCLGTDSLASNDDLDLCSEANAILDNTKIFNTSDVLRMMTGNGAAALGLEKSFGSFIPGKNTGLNVVQFKNGRISLTKKIF